ncbi:MAG: ABC transporter ATP-binding protein, partial [Halobacteriaceae archaeon]
GKARGSFELGPINLSIDDEILSVLGPSGCGKTTLLNLIAGILSPDCGEIVLDGNRIDEAKPESRGTVLVFQEGALFPHMTARENIEYAATSERDLRELTQLLEIQDILDQSASTLSGGEAQRVALGRALAADPDALLLDEPLANLDAPIRRRLRDDFRELLAPLSIPVVYVTHDQTEASSIGDRIAVMSDGRMVQVGTPTDVFERPATKFVARFTGSSNVFRGTVIDDSHIQWGEEQLETSVSDRTSGDEVWFCVRPESIHVAVERIDNVENLLQGTISTTIFEGDSYRVHVQPDGAPEQIEMSVPPPDFKQFDLHQVERLEVSVPPTSIHVIDDVS